MATAMDRAVNLQEIVNRFAWFLRLWEPNEELAAFVFYLQDVVACSQVCHAWYGTLLPLPGRSYDGEGMERWSIVWHDYLSPHCRPVRLNTTTLLECPLPSLLQEIKICTLIDHSQAIQVLHRLSWPIPDMRDPNTILHTDVIIALEPLLCLRSLTLDNFRWCFDRFSHLINRNTESEEPHGVTLLRPRKNRKRLVHGERHGAELELRLVVPPEPDGPDLEQPQPGTEDPTGRTLPPLRPMRKPARAPPRSRPSDVHGLGARRSHLGGAIRDQVALLVTSIERLNSLE